MLRWAIIFLIVAIIAAVFGFGGIAGEAAWIAKLLFVVFLVVWGLMTHGTYAGSGDEPHYLIVAQSIGLAEPRLARGDVYWLEMRPQERGRYVVVRNGVDLTPPPYNVRTRANEYGGGAWTVANGALYFSHDADRRLYRLDRDGAPAPLTPEGPWRFADGIVDSRGRWIGVREDHSRSGEPAKSINAL